MTYILIALGVLALYFLFFASKKEGTKAYTNIGPQDAKALINQKNTIIIDVRTPAEVAQGKIKGAKNINISSPSFLKGIEGLDKSKNYLVYCRSGKRSARACSIMSGRGFENLYNLQGGYMGWR